MNIEAIREILGEADKYSEQEMYEDALKLYFRAMKYVHNPIIDYEISTEIITCIGDTYFFMGDFDKADQSFNDVMMCPNATANPYIRLRRGEVALELGNIVKARTELACAFMNGGMEIFDGEDNKYLEFIKDFIEQRRG